MANNRFKAYITNNPLKDGLGNPGNGLFWNGSDDRLRSKLRAYWVAGTDIQPVLSHTQEPGGSTTLEQIFAKSSISISEYNSSFAEEIPATTDFYRMEETFVITGKAFYGWDAVSFDEFLTSFNEKTYTDCTIFFRVPLVYPEHETQDNYNLELVKTDFVYNFLHPNYESFTSTKINESITTADASYEWERYMPNLYGYYIAKNTQEFEQPNCVGGVDASTGAPVANSQGCFAGNLITEFMIFDNSAEWLSPGARADDSSDFMERYKNITFSVDNPQVLTKAKSMLSNFPMYIQMEWPSYGSSQFATALRDAQLDDDLFRSTSEYYDPDIGNDGGVWGSEQYQIVEAVEELETNEETGEVTVNLIPSYTDYYVNYMSVFPWWADIQTRGGTISTRNLSSDYNNFVVMDERGSTSTGTSLTNLLKTLVFYGKLKGLVRDHFRSWSSLVKGETCHSEMVFFRVVKRRGVTSSEILQTIWIPDFPDLNITQYIDTQVGYDQTYFYEVSVFKFVIGARYTYTVINTSAAEDSGLHTHDTVDRYDGYDSSPSTQPPGSTRGGRGGLRVHTSRDDDYDADGDGLYDLDGTDSSAVDESSQYDSGFLTADSDLSGVDLDLTGVTSTSNSAKFGVHHHTYKMNRITSEGKTALDDTGHYHIIHDGMACTHGSITPYANSNDTLDHSHNLTPDIDFTEAVQIPESLTGGTATSEWNKKIKVVTVPSFKLIECGYATFGGRIIDSPPVPPHVDIIPFKGVNNKLMINLNTSIGEYRLEPVIIYDSDQILIDKIRETKGLSGDSLITYKTDDRVKYFDTFRTTTPPQSYADFKENYRGVVPTTIDGTVETSAASFIDLVSSNVVYYYMFRAIDYHGYVSNPSPIYKVELVEQDGAIYPLIEVYNTPEEIEKNPPYQLSRKFQKLISIIPNYSQATVDNSVFVDETTGAPYSGLAESSQKVKLGIMPDNLFGKTFKIRLISKKTGRKMDFNLSFVVNKLL